jgi:RNA polymerase sigma-70 factor (ECF subfamily)
MEEEEVLLVQAREGSHEAFCGLLRLHQGRVRAYLNSYIYDRDAADDLAQESFLAAYRSLPTFRGEAPFGLWLLRIAKNKALAYLRDEARRRSRREEGSFASLLAGTLACCVEAEDLETSSKDGELEALRACVERLPNHSAALIRGYYFKNRSAIEIGRELGKGKSAIGMTLLRIRAALRQCMESRLASSESGA